MRGRLLEAFYQRVERLRLAGLLSPEDLLAWDRLLDRDGPKWLGHRDDLYWLEARSIHIGRRAG